MGTDNEHDSLVVLSTAQVSEIVSALADGEARRAEVMLRASGQLDDSGFTDDEHEWASKVRTLHGSADTDPAASASRLEAALRSQVAGLVSRCDDGDESAAYPLQLICIHVLKHAGALIERTGLPLEGLDFAIAGVQSRAKGAARDRSGEDNGWRGWAADLRDQADLLVRVSLDLYQLVERFESLGSHASPVSWRAALPRRHWQTLEEAFDDMCAESRGSAESVHDRGRGILETLRPRSVPPSEPRGDVDELRRDCYEVIGALVHFVDDAVDNPDFCIEVGDKVRKLADRMLADSHGVPVDVEAMLHRIDLAVSRDGLMVDGGSAEGLALLRRRAFHLLELGISEAGDAGIDVAGIENAVEAAFEVPDDCR